MTERVAPIAKNNANASHMTVCFITASPRPIEQKSAVSLKPGTALGSFKINSGWLEADWWRWRVDLGASVLRLRPSVAWDSLRDTHLCPHAQLMGALHPSCDANGFQPRRRRSLQLVLLPLLAFAKALRDRRSSINQRSLIREPLREIGVIVLHDVEHSFLGKPAMVIGKEFVQVSEPFVVHGFRASVAIP